MTDRSERDTALDTARSFIVQAPAGSGKTELLIQRFLALLATVAEPEQAIAITFTRKAAAEMRARILRALRSAAEQEPVTEPHQKRTRELATAALARSTKLDWRLTTQPQRLRIDTLDALNAWLAQRLPVLAGGVSGATVVENAREYYIQATRRVLEELSNSGELGVRLMPLLQRLDNRLERLEILLVELLPRREQWLQYLATGSDDELRQVLEGALENLVAEELERLAGAVPAATLPEIVALLRHAAETATDADYSAALAEWEAAGGELTSASDHLGIWQALADLLLVKNPKWRSRLPSKLGFGANYPTERARFRDLLDVLEPEMELLTSLHGVRSLPAPHYDEAQWRILSDLRVVLLRLAAELRVVFAERDCVDFVEMTLAAENALGEADVPSELLLALDQRIQHILVDEFQDTSHTQLRLLRLLTAGWQPDDGRTLFLVGDPMQSIYRFRNADMSLFLKTKIHGIGDVHCESVTLTRNFRSAPSVIDWVNNTFADVFPERDDVGTGAARFYPSEKVREPSPDTRVEFHPLRSDEPQTEVAKVIELLIDERKHYPEDSVAVLVQSRSHLAGLHEQLRDRELNVRAVELEPPTERQIVQDLLGLTRALTHLADRIAWLGVLRAPWCGMTWADLHDLVANDRDQSVWMLVNDLERLERLSDDGRLRLTHCVRTLRRAFECRAQQPLTRWIERTWVTLGGPACLESADELEQADRFFSSLAEIERRGDLDDPASLEFLFSDPRGQGDVPAESGVEIMTIHRAKGLEFDSVILLGLSRIPRPDQGRGLYWLERTTNSGQEDLLLAPLTATTGERDPLTDYLKNVEQRRDYAERARLMYVATTRARNRLNLVARLSPEAEKPARQSLLELLWPSVEDRFDGIETDTGQRIELESIQPVLRRLPETFDLAKAFPEDGQAPATVAPRPEFEWAGQAALQIGTVVHDALQRIAEQSADAWDTHRVHREADRFRAELRLLGVEEGELSAAAERVAQALCLVLADSTGCWLLQDHTEAASELPVTIRSAAGLEHVRLDRTFVDDKGTRWIIDFKTSAHEGGSKTEFLDSEVERYRSQLNRYAGAMAAIDDRPIKVGLYFPLLQAFRDWTPDIR